MKPRKLFSTKRELATALGLSERRITQLVTAGVLPAREPKGFDVLASVQCYVAFLRSQPGDLKAERVRYTKVKADLLSLQLEQRRGELVSRAESDREAFAIGKAVRDGMENIPARLSGILAAESSQELVFECLRKEINLALWGLVNEQTKQYTPATQP